MDFVVVLSGFVDHAQSEPIVAAARESGLAWAMAESYGVSAVKSGIERFLGSAAAGR